MMNQRIKNKRGQESRMKKTVNKWGISWEIFVLFFLCMILAPGFAVSDETYRFERMWPVVQQSWYYLNTPVDIAIETNGNVYVVDRDNNRIPFSYSILDTY